MEIKTNIKIEISEDDVKQIIAEYINKKTGYKVTNKDVSLLIGSRSEGYGMAEHEVNYFKGACVTYKEV